MLNYQNISFGYKKDEITLDNVSFSLDEGSINVFVGENGAGKSTIFRILLGFLKPKNGHISFDDTDLLALSSGNRAKYIAYVPQNVEMPGLSVFDVVAMGRIPHNSIKLDDVDKKVILNTIKEFGLEKIASKNANELSGGEKQLVAIARAVAQEPKIIILDEPTSNLDVVNEYIVKKYIKKLKEKNLIVILSLHNLNMAYALGDYYVFIKNGKVIASGAKDIFNNDTIKDAFGKDCRIIEIDDQKFFDFGGIEE